MTLFISLTSNFTQVTAVQCAVQCVQEVMHKWYRFLPNLFFSRYVCNTPQVAAVQCAVQCVQEVMHKWDGSFMQFRCDEKGFVAICAFGLPAHTHEDNAARGIFAALELVKRIE